MRNRVQIFQFFENQAWDFVGEGKIDCVFPNILKDKVPVPELRLELLEEPNHF